MTRRSLAYCGVSAAVIAFTAQSALAQTTAPSAAQQGRPAAAAAPSAATLQELVVTALKREQNLNDVGMSVQAASGEKLTQLGITSTEDLKKIIPGFEVTPNYYGTNVYTIRGVGFQDTSLAGSPTVTVYQDEAPLPFSILTSGTTMDLQRVEVLKGPQGTLFGNNATAGAINYVASKPTDYFAAGGHVTLGNYDRVNVEGYVSGPLLEGVDARFAFQSLNSGAWQKGYGPQSGQETGGQDFQNARLSVSWKPNDQFRALLTANAWWDKSYNQVGQFYGLAGGRNHIMPQFLLDYPLAPHTPEAASWVGCVNKSPFDPISGQNLGTLYLTPINPDGTPAPAGFQTGPAPKGYAGKNVESESNDNSSVVVNGGQPTDCTAMRRDNKFYSVNLRMDYEFGNGLTLTSLTEYLHFHRYAGVDGAGVPEQDYQSLQRGEIETVYQELRLSGKFWGGKGNWLVGVNYEYDDTSDHFLQTYNGSTASPTQIPFSGLCFAGLGACTPAEMLGSPSYNPALYPLSLDLTLGPTEPADFQRTNTYAVFAHGEYPILDNLTLVGGLRFTQEDKTGKTCGLDGGDGSWALVAQNISNLLEVLSPAGYLQQTYGAATPAKPIGGFISAVDAYLQGAGKGINGGPHSCGTTGPAPLFQSFGAGSPGAKLNQNNVSWEAGLDWKFDPTTLVYLHISQGYKGGSFPTVAMSSSAQAVPVSQEDLLSYEVGVKGTWLDNQVQLNGAIFYYDYTDKQILGAETDPIFGPLATLVNVPKSHVSGFELSAVATPHAVEGLTLSAGVSYQNSRIDNCSGGVSNFGNCVNGHYITPDAFSKPVDITGQSFPSAPEWQGYFDGQYDWKIVHDINAFAGIHVQYSDVTHTGFQDPTPPATPPVYVPGAACGGPVLCYEPGKVPAYTLIDLRAGIEKDAWRAEVWGRNITNKWYWTAADRVNDTILRYTGMPTTYGVTITYRYH
jgi:outer membrane receptor protein involved in Fe transport